MTAEVVDLGRLRAAKATLQEEAARKARSDANWAELAGRMSHLIGEALAAELVDLARVDLTSA